MRFEGRDLKPYADHVRPADLTVGHVYFRVRCLDKDMAVPEREPLVFIGRDLHPEGPGLYYQDAESWLVGERADASSFDPFELSDDADGLTWIMDGKWFEMEREREYASVQEFDQALDSLLRCSIRRQTWDGEPRQIPRPESPGE